MVSGRKGWQWPTALLSMVFSMVLLIFGTMILADAAKAINVNDVKYQGTVNFYAVAARVMNSPDCAAWEEYYENGYQPHLGIIDFNSFNQNRIENCIKDRNFAITLSHNGKTTYLERNPNDLKGAVTEVFPVRVRENNKMYDGFLTMTIK